MSSTAMAPTPLANVHSVTDTLLAIPILTRSRPHTAWTRPQILASSGGSTSTAAAPQQASRRTALGLGLASIALAGGFVDRASLAEDNGYWYIGPIPVPPIYNKIANEATGTRSFVRSGIYIANIGEEGSRYRIRKYAFDLLALGDLVQKDLLNYVRRYLRLKGTIMYYDFDKVISAAPEPEKQPILDLANRLFDKLEKLEDAAKRDDFPAAEAVYKDAAVILQEVRDEIKYQSVGFLGAIGLWNLNILKSAASV
ncbi:hypothetical protein MLD38_034210 [Melastoma candidum]|uniref:Uncharacterized protein n=1 Tax=Melastoma candidum TaxID=119954 RepID=A0ACB9MDH8_9MYRT|nr:hypothetical protein MLD38_034210 [Melastoma candidum]